MGSLSLIIVLIVVVWVIVLAPMVMGNNKPIRRSGDGYEETRVLHSGGSAPVPGRRRPKLTRADVHRFDNDGERYEVVEPENVDVNEGSTLVEPELVEADTTIEGEVVEPATGGSTALSVLESEQEQAEEVAEDVAEEPYPLEETYVSPGDFVAYAEPASESDPEPAAAEQVEERIEEQGEPLTDEELDFARARRGRGGWDPERDQAAKQDRFMRRQRTLLALIVADVVTFVAAFVAGGWVWVLPALTIGLTVWFMIVLRGVVRQERALHQRRIRQLRRARMGVVSGETAAPVPSFRRRPGAVVVDMDDESPDFDELPRGRYEPVDTAPVAVAARAS
ncbi:gephyrin-like molybdotransferase receptor GlpR [Corynebacterium sp.]|uniref:divisome protein SepX/GlpR n=1 Tax=Corynebacterium sp. TaxID=1720 RepID=UPI002A918DD9|nr:gephyrin-like molybdotransferase receptor GlpR [Corynebacterium sp.]MDY5786207.1 hypothetical protein [Corynebacterium sp.]